MSNDIRMHNLRKAKFDDLNFLMSHVTCSYKKKLEYMNFLCADYLFFSPNIYEVCKVFEECIFN